MKPLIPAADEFAFHKSHAILSAEFLRRNKWGRQLTIYRLLPYIPNSRVTGAVSTYGKFMLLNYLFQNDLFKQIKTEINIVLNC